MKKIVVIGPESTGKSTLCTQLALHYHTSWVQEYARAYLLRNGTRYSYDDLLQIAKGQLSLEEQSIASLSNHTLSSPSPKPLLFIDTDMVVMKVWCEVVFENCHQYILDQIACRSYDLYLLCDTDLPWVKDELREYPDLAMRRKLFHIYRDTLINQHTPWALISGSYEERLQASIYAINVLNHGSETNFIMTIHQATQFLQSQLASLYDEREAANITALIMERVTGWQRIDRVLNKQYALLPAQMDLLKEYTNQLLQHRPVQYVLEEAWFYGMKFYVNGQVLIPRPETEELVDWVVRDMRKEKEPSILDIGTGSGCIAVALKKELPGAQMHACDISQGALQVAGRNAVLNNVQLNFLQLDFLQPEQRSKLPPVDVLVSNPPYIPLIDKAAIHPNVLQYEPHLALFVTDDDPLIFYKAMVRFARAQLQRTMHIYVEIHEDMARSVSELFYDGGFDKVEIRRDLQGKERMIKAVLNRD